MFTWLNKQGVESSQGFSLQSIGRHFYHYTDGDRVMRINVEPLQSPSGEYYEEVLESSFGHWLPPHEGEDLPADSTQRIRQNVADALKFMGIKHNFR